MIFNLQFEVIPLLHTDEIDICIAKCLPHPLTKMHFWFGKPESIYSNFKVKYFMCSLLESQIIYTPYAFNSVMVHFDSLCLHKLCLFAYHKQLISHKLCLLKCLAIWKTCKHVKNIIQSFKNFIKHLTYIIKLTNQFKDRSQTL